MPIDRSEAEQRYAIRGGHEGKKRLDLLAQVMLPTTAQSLDRVGLILGMKCLDAGWGSDHVALLMASMLGPDGRVIGTDTDEEILALARRNFSWFNLRTLMVKANGWRLSRCREYQTH